MRLARSKKRKVESMLGCTMRLVWIGALSLSVFIIVLMVLRACGTNR